MTHGGSRWDRDPPFSAEDLRVRALWAARGVPDGPQDPARYPCHGCTLAPTCALAYDIGNLDRVAAECERERR